MAHIEVTMNHRSMEVDVLPPRKRFKASELPISPSQRSVIDGILHTFKKKGEFDTLRKQLWDQYSESEDKMTFISSLEDLAETEIDRDPSLLSRDRGKAATLMQGAVDRSNIYKSVESSLDRLLAEHLAQVQATFREIRRAEVGESTAAEEQTRAAKTDEEYAAEAAARRDARAEQKRKDEARKRREEEKEALRAEEAKKKAELDKLRRREERRKEDEAKAAKRAKDREASRALRKKVEEEEQRKQLERRERRAREELERHTLQDRSHERARSAHTEAKIEPPSVDTPMPDAAPQVSPTAAGTPVAPPIDEKDLEAIALERLLDEGRELAAKSGPERSGSLSAPSLRGGQIVKSLKLGDKSPPKGPASDRMHSPLKIDPPKGPRLSYSQTHRNAYSPLTAETRQRSRSPSCSHSIHAISRRDSASTLRGTYDSEAKAAWKKQVAPRDDEREPYQSSTTRARSHTVENEDDSHRHNYHPSEQRSKDYQRDYREERDRDQEREKYKERGDTDFTRSREPHGDRRHSQHEYEKDHRSSRTERSRSHDRSREHERNPGAGYRDRDYESRTYKDRDHDRDYHRSHSARYTEENGHRARDSELIDRRYTRSRSPTSRSTNLHQKPNETLSSSSHGDNRPARTSDRPAPVEIDRYVPSTSIRAKVKDHAFTGEKTEEGREREKEKERSARIEPKERSDHRDRERDRENGDVRGGYKDRDDYREKDRERDRERHRERDAYKERERDRDRDKETEEARGGYKARDDYRERDRDRDRERYRERDAYKERDRDRDREREKEIYKERGRDRDRETRDRDRYAERDRHDTRSDRHSERDHADRDKKGYVEIDRYVPSSSSRAKELEHPRSRDGDRDRDRERERERERPKERERER